MSERQQLEHAIAALESQRQVLGDAVVDTLVALARQRLIGLSSAPPEQRRQVTILFADVAGFTAMVESMDAEEATDFMNVLWERLDSVIIAHGGLIDKHIGDAVMALWGAQVVREDDAEQAIRAALRMQEEIAAFTAARPATHLKMRIGINTGPVLVGFIGTLAEFTAMGDAVNLASRLEHAAPPGSVLISHNTYRHVRGLFDVVPQEPLAVKGKQEPVRTYVVQRAKAHAFRMATRGVEGIETRLVGREREMGLLQQAFHAALGNANTHLVTVVAEAGLGKSRLLQEFEDWLELRPEELYLLKGRAFPQTIHVPYSLLRDLFRDRFEILESDSAATARDKFVAGVGAYLDADRAHLVGQLIGFDFSATAAVRNLLGSPSFALLAMAYLSDYFRDLTADRPTLIFLEDIHWADSPSLDIVTRLTEQLADRQMLIVCLSRPTLFERRPDWGRPAPPAPSLLLRIPKREGAALKHTAYLRLDLAPLSSADTQALVEEILQQVDFIPADLREFVVQSAEGNPFYVEELIKMLMDDGVIRREGPRWHVEMERLKQVRVPSTLTGILQARLDGLPTRERGLLQRAAVVGREFWDALVAEMSAGECTMSEVQSGLEMVRARELVFRQRHSAFAGTREYLFKHTLLRDVSYETVLLKLRRAYHRRVAEWLEEQSGDRQSEYTGLIAEHYERAGEKVQAAVWLRRAGDAAYQTSAYQEAIASYERALALLPDKDLAGRAGLLLAIGKCQDKLADYGLAERRCREALELARQAQDLKTVAEALGKLCWLAEIQSDRQTARALSGESLAAARASGDPRTIAQGLMCQAGYAENYSQACQTYEEALSIFKELGDRADLGICYLNMGNTAYANGDSAAAARYYEASLAIYRQTGNRWGIGNCLANLGLLAQERGDYEAARRYCKESLAIAREIGDREGVAICLLHLGEIALQTDTPAAALEYLRAALREAMTIGMIPIVQAALVETAKAQAESRDPTRAAEWLGLLQGNPDRFEAGDDIAALLERLRAALPAAKLQAALERGRKMDLETAIRQVLADDVSPSAT